MKRAVMKRDQAPRPVTKRISTGDDVALCVVGADAAAAAAGLDAAARQRFATAVSELGRNIIKFAGTGEIRIDQLTRGTRSGVEATATDAGPGIADLDQAMTDHYSSAGTLGIGLPGVKRMMDEFEIDSELHRGTSVTIRKWR
jgi:serine/threonine-protein kinase RsbT